MNSWILSIVGIVCLGVIIDIFIPEGSTNKYIKGVFSLLIVFVVISPLPKFIKGDFNFDKILNSTETNIDLNFIASVNNQKCDAIEKIIKAALNEEDIETNSITVTCNVFKEEFEILTIYVDISDIVNKNTDNLKIEIINTINKNININKEQIIFNE